jgi:ABC-type phosphate transport system substrate-binding protein
MLRTAICLCLIILIAVPLALEAKKTASGTTGKIIVNQASEVDTLKRTELVRIYLGKKTLWASGAKIAPALLPEDSAVTQSFIQQILRKSVDQYRVYWKRRLFSGAATLPKSFRTSAEVVDFVARNPGAIGLVDKAPDDKRVKLIEIEE